VEWDFRGISLIILSAGWLSGWPRQIAGGRRFSRQPSVALAKRMRSAIILAVRTIGLKSFRYEQVNLRAWLTVGLLSGPADSPGIRPRGEGSERSAIELCGQKHFDDVEVRCERDGA
jgi:hypothetical protein